MAHVCNIHANHIVGLGFGAAKGEGIVVTGAVIGYDVTNNQITLDPDGDGSADFAMTDTGRLGIGVTNPTNLIDAVAASSTDAYISLEADTDYDYGMLFRENDTDTWRIRVDGDDANRLKFEDFNGSTWDNNVTIRESGLVGIGINTPASPLHVYNASDIGITVESSDNASSVALKDPAETWYLATNNGPFYIRQGSTSKNVFYIESGAQADSIRIDSGGYVGIGTDNPNEMLTVNDALSLAETSAATLTSGFGKLYVKTDGKLYYLDDDNNETDLTGGGGATWSASGNDLYYNTGSVGVGVTNPAAKMDVGITTPTLISEVSDGDGEFSYLDAGRDVQIQGNYAYVVSYDDSGFSIIDISLPENPELMSEVYDGDGEFDKLQNPSSVFVQGIYAYVTSYTDDAVTIIDISDPTDPVMVSEISDGEAGFTRLNGANDIYVAGNYAYIVSALDAAITIMDISNPYGPAFAFEEYFTGGYQGHSIYVSDNYAYIGAFNYLKIYDVSDPYNASLTDDIYYNNFHYIDDIVVSGRFAYMVGQTRLWIVDVSDPNDIPGYTSYFTGLSTPYRLDVAGDYAYVASTGSYDRIKVLDVSDSTNITEVFTIDDGSDGFTKLEDIGGIDVHGNYLYVASGGTDNGFTIIDVAGFKTQNAEIGNLLAGSVQIMDNLAVDNDVNIRGDISAIDAFFAGDVAIHDTTSSTGLHVVKGGSGAALKITHEGEGDFLSIYDSTTEILSITYDSDREITEFSGAPMLALGRNSSPAMKAEVYDGDGEFSLLDNPNYLEVQGNLAFVLSDGDSDSLTIIDITDPEDPKLLSEVYDEDGEFSRLGTPTSIFVQGKYAYITSAGTDDALTIIDISDPTDPDLVSEIYEGLGDYDKLNGLKDVYVAGIYAYLVGDGEQYMTIVDISDPANPVNVSETYFNVGRVGHQVYVSGKYAYISIYDYLAIYDISDPTTPVLEDNIYLSSVDTPYSLQVTGGYAWFVGGSRLWVYDVTDPDDLTTAKANFVTITTTPYDVHVVNNYAYVAAQGSDNVKIYDVSDTSNMTLVGYAQDGNNGFSRLDEVSGVRVQGNYLYAISDGSDDGFTVMDVGGLEAPTAEIGSLLAGTIQVTDNFQVNNDAIINGRLTAMDARFYGGLSIYDEDGGINAFEVSTDTAGYMAQFYNDGNNANRYGIRVQAGADAASGVTYYLSAYDGDGDLVGYIENNSGTFQLVDPSDIRTKTKVTDSSMKGLEIIQNLRVVDYNRVQNPDGPQITGFIAQEVQEVFPEMVSTGPDGLLGVSQQRLIPVLTRAVQEQQVQIEDNRKNLTQVDDELLLVNTKLSDTAPGVIELSQEVESFESQVSEDFAAMEEEISDVKLHSEELTTRLDNLEQALSSLDSSSAGSEEEVNIESLQGALESLADSLDSLDSVSGQLSTLSDSILTVMESNQALSARIDALDSTTGEISQLVKFTDEKVVIGDPERFLVIDAVSGLEINSENFTLDSDGNVMIAGDLSLRSGKINSESGTLELDPGHEDGRESEVVIKGNLKVQGKIILDAYDERNIDEEDDDEKGKYVTRGKDVIKAGYTDVVVESRVVNEDSLINIIPLSKTSGQILFISDIRNKDKYDEDAGETFPQGFTVSIEEPADEDIWFNWWIVEAAYPEEAEE